MREILFRGKDVYGKWLYGDLINLTGEIKQICNHTQLEHAHGVNPETVGQYTGLVDKNGKRIFEGDIVRTLAPCSLDKYIKGVIMFGEYSTSHQSSNNGYYVNWSLNKNLAMYCKINDIEIIGNIHDNPELLKGGEGDG